MRTSRFGEISGTTKIRNMLVERHKGAMLPIHTLFTVLQDTSGELLHTRSTGSISGNGRAPNLSETLTLTSTSQYLLTITKSSSFRT